MTKATVIKFVLVTALAAAVWHFTEEFLNKEKL